MKILREIKSKSIYDDFFHDTFLELENFKFVFSSFSPFVPSLPKQQTTANSFSVTTVSCNKSKQLFVDLRQREACLVF